MTDILLTEPKYRKYKMRFLIIIFPGEHTDYNMGLVFPMALPLVTVVLGARSEDTGSDKCRLYSSSQVGDDFNRYTLTENPFLS